MKVSELQRVILDGKSATVAEWQNGWLIAKFDDGSVSYLEPVSPRAASRAGGPLHAIADSHQAKLEVALRYAFAVARKAVPKNITRASQADEAIAVFGRELQDVLPNALAPIIAEGGAHAIDGLSRIKAAEEPRALAPARAKMSVVFTAKNAKVQEAAGLQTLQLIKDITETTRDRIRNALAAHVGGGSSDRDFFDAIDAAIGDPVRARVIARTETMRSVNQGQQLAWSAAVDAGLLDANAQQVWLITDDEKLCPICADLEDEETDLDGEWKTLDGDKIDGPPAHPNCILPGSVISGRIIAGLRAIYDGPAREIKTRQGNILRLTVNHPILTTQGWVSALKLRVGMQLFGQRINVQYDVRPQQHDDYQCPTFVEDIFKTLSTHGLTTVQPRSLDLHGDAGWVDNKIDIVGSNLLLRNDGPTFVSQLCGKFDLPHTETRESFLIGNGSTNLSFERIDVASSSVPRATTLTDNGTTIQLQSTPLQKLLFGLASQWNVVRLKESGEWSTTDPSFILKLQERSAGQITIDEILEIRDFNFSGHVYDLQSDVGWIVSQNIVISNCRCTLGIAGD